MIHLFVLCNNAKTEQFSRKIQKTSFSNTNPRLSQNEEFYIKSPVLSLFYIHGILHSCRLLEKALQRFMRKTNGRTDQDGRLLRTPSDKPGFQNDIFEIAKWLSSQKINTKWNRTYSNFSFSPSYPKYFVLDFLFLHFMLLTTLFPKIYYPLDV